METYPNFNQTLIEAADQRSGELRKQGEARLKALKIENAQKFVLSLIMSLMDNDLSDDARQLSAFLFKNTLINATQDEGGNDLWYGLTEETRGHIKSALMTLLQSPNDLVLKSAGISLGIIAAIEVPDNKWPEFLNIMFESSTHQDMRPRLAVVQTLGFMCDFLHYNVPKDLAQEQVGQVLHATICNINPDQIELSRIAIKALQRTLPATASNFAVAEQREFIMNGIFSAIQIQDNEVQSEALQALSELPEITYSALTSYLPRIREMTEQLITAQRPLDLRKVLNFWINFASEEINQEERGQSLNLISQLADSFMQVIYQCLCITELDEDDTDVEENTDDIDWTVSRLAAILLTKVAFLLKDRVLEETIQFASMKLNGQHWQETYVGMMALGSVMEGPSSEAINAQLVPAYMQIIQTIRQNENPRVRHSIIWLLSQIAKHVPQLILARQENFNELVNLCVYLLEERGIHIQIKQYAAVTFQSLFEEGAKLSSEHQVVNERLNSCFMPIVKAICECLFTDIAFNTGTLTGFSGALNTIIEVCNYEAQPMQETIFNFLGAHYERVVGFIQNPLTSQLNNEQLEFVLNHYCGVFQPGLARLHSDKINDQMITMFVQLANQIFQRHQKVTMAGLLILNGLISSTEARIFTFVPEFINYILQALKMENCDPQGCRLACGLVSDLSSAIGKQIAPFLPEMMNLILAILEDATFDTEVKLIALDAIGDLCLAGERLFLQYLDKTKTTFQGASEMSLKVSQDPEEIEVLKKLRIALITSYHSILHGLTSEDTETPHVIQDFTMQIYYYIEAMVMNRSLQFPLDVLLPLYELYQDMVQLQLREIGISMSGRQVGIDSRGNRTGNQLHDLSNRILYEGSLLQELQNGTQALPEANRASVQHTLSQLAAQIESYKSRMAGPSPQHHTGVFAN